MVKEDGGSDQAFISQAKRADTQLPMAATNGHRVGKGQNRHLNPSGTTGSTSQATGSFFPIPDF